MFNLFSRIKKKTKATGKSGANKAVSKKSHTNKRLPEIPPLTPDQTVHQSAAKLEAASRQLDNGTIADEKHQPQDREELIKHALAVHKVKSKLLDHLDENTHLDYLQINNQLMLPLKL